VVVRDPVIGTGAAITELASNATYFSNFENELVALMFRSKSMMKKTCDY